MSDDNSRNIENVKDDVVGEVETAVEETTTAIREYTRASEETIMQAVDDVAANVEERKDEVGTFVSRLTSGEITSKQELVVNLVEVAGKEETKFTAGAAAGAYIGSFGGPIGSVLGASAGAGAVYLATMEDDRTLFAIPLDDDGVPPGVEPIPASDTPLAESPVIMDVLDEALEETDASKIENRPTRSIDLDNIERTLSGIAYHQPNDDEYYSGHYVIYDAVPVVLFVGDRDTIAP